VPCGGDGGAVGAAGGKPGGCAQGWQARQGRRCGRQARRRRRQARRLSAAAARAASSAARAVRPAARVARAGGARKGGKDGGNGGKAARPEARVARAGGAGGFPGGAGDKGEHPFLPAWVKDPMSIGPPTRRCCASFGLAACTTRTLARSRWSTGSRSLLTRVCRLEQCGPIIRAVNDPKAWGGGLEASIHCCDILSWAGCLNVEKMFSQTSPTPTGTGLGPSVF